LNGDQQDFEKLGGKKSRVLKAKEGGWKSQSLQGWEKGEGTNVIGTYFWDRGEGLGGPRKERLRARVEEDWGKGGGKKKVKRRNRHPAGHRLR